MKTPRALQVVIYSGLRLLTTVRTTSVDAAPMVLVEETALYHTVKDAIDSAEMDLNLGTAVLKAQTVPSFTQNSANSLLETESV